MASTGTRVAQGNRHKATVLATQAIEVHDHELVPLVQIRTDGGTQNRAALTEPLIAEYREIMDDQGGWGKFPPVKLTYDGTDYWLTDGFHRVAALRRWMQANKTDPLVPAKIEPGDLREAVLRSFGENSEHGLRRTNADKHRAVTRMLQDEEWGYWSDEKIAARCAVSSRYVGKLRKALEESGKIAPQTVREGADGRVRAVTNIGRVQRAPAQPQSAPAPQPALEPVVEWQVAPSEHLPPHDPATGEILEPSAYQVKFVSLTLTDATAQELLAAARAGVLKNYLLPYQVDDLIHTLADALEDV